MVSLIFTVLLMGEPLAGIVNVHEKSFEIYNIYNLIENLY